MIPKDLLAIVTSADQEAALAAAEGLSQRWSAHLAVLHLTALPPLVAGEQPFSVNLWAEHVAKSREMSAAERQSIMKRVANLEPSAEVRSVEAVATGAERIAGFNALHADLTIVERSQGDLWLAAFEGALFRSGRPILLMPSTWRDGRLGRRIMVAWEPKREAARALADAGAFLAEAEHVSVVTVDSKIDADGARPGVAISTHLARRPLDVDLRQVDGLGRDPAEALLDEAHAINADLIVMGGYGHSRMRELVLGGVTRTMLEISPIPIFMTH